MRFFFKMISIIVLISINSFSATYYIDVTNGSDNNNGLSPVNAWNSINKVNISTFYPGDSILFKRGLVWAERLVVTTSGNVNSSIYYGAYGDGKLPIISGSGQRNACIEINGYNYITIENLAVENANNLEQGNIYGNRCQYVKLNGIQSRNGVGFGVVFYNCVQLSINNCVVSFSGKGGIRLGSTNISFILSEFEIISNTSVNNGLCGIEIITTNGGEVRNGFINNNDCHNNGESGIQIERNVHNISIIRNRCDSNGNEIWGTGIEVWGENESVFPYNIIVERNSTRYNKDSSNTGDGVGIRLDDHTRESVVRYNVCENNEGTGIALHLTTNCKVYYNLLIENNTTNKAQFSNIGILRSIDSEIINNTSFGSKLGINIEYDTRTNGTRIINNIVFGYNYVGIMIPLSLSSTTVENYNCSFSIQSNSLPYADENFNAITKGVNSLNQDPLFRDIMNYDFTLSSESPAIDAGTQTDITRDYNNALVPYPVGGEADMGVLEYYNISSPRNVRIK